MNKTSFYAIGLFLTVVLAVVGWTHFSTNRNTVLMDSVSTDSIETVDSLNVVDSVLVSTVDTLLEK